MIGKIAEAKTKRGSSYSGSDLSGEYSIPHSCGDGTFESAPNCNSGGHVQVVEVSESKTLKQIETRYCQ